MPTGGGKDNPNYRHGGSGTRLYRIWAAMKTRCMNPNFWAYNHYGGRGIKVCRAWQKFPAFQRWALSNGYRDKLTIERKNNDRGYCPSNCKWATRKEQSSNQRMHCNNTSGYSGIVFNKQHNIRPWRAKYKGVHIGMFSTGQEANNARLHYIKTGQKPTPIGRSPGKSGFRGVHPNPQSTLYPWMSFYTKGKAIRKYIGQFKTPLAAHRARLRYIRNLQNV